MPKTWFITGASLGLGVAIAKSGHASGRLDLFRISAGESPHRFLLRQRVEHAKEMLREAEMRVLDVAVACGFKTQQHFARVFRRICGASPTEYRYEAMR